jgi:hypothetical protein
LLGQGVPERHKPVFSELELREHLAGAPLVERSEGAGKGRMLG